MSQTNLRNSYDGLSNYIFIHYFFPHQMLIQRLGRFFRKFSVTSTLIRLVHIPQLTSAVTTDLDCPKLNCITTPNKIKKHFVPQKLVYMI